MTTAMTCRVCYTFNSNAVLIAYARSMLALGIMMGMHDMRACQAAQGKGKRGKRESGYRKWLFLPTPSSFKFTPAV